MSYDKNGNYDYEAAAAERRFRSGPSLYARLGDRLSGGAKAVGCIVAVLLVAGGFFGCAYAVLYGAGRAVEHGMHDGAK